MAISLPRLRRPSREDLPQPSEIVERIKLPDLPDLPDLPELPRLAKVAQLRQLPEMPDLSALPDRLRGRQRRAVARGTTWTRVGIAALVVTVTGIVGAAAAYFLDPARGRIRRIETANRLAGRTRQARERIGRLLHLSQEPPMLLESSADHPDVHPGNGVVKSPDLISSNPGL